MSDLSERVSALLDVTGDEAAMLALTQDPVLRADPALVPAAIALYDERAATASAADQVTMLVAIRTICGQAIPVAVDSQFEPLIARVPGPVAAAALLLIGQVQLAQGNLKGSLETLDRVVGTGDDQAAPQAGLLIGSLLAERAPADAEKLARYVLARWPAFGSAAQIRLGYLLAARGDLAGAVQAYQAAADSGDADNAPRAMASLGDLRRRAGHDDEAIGWYERAIETGHPYQAGRATVNLAGLRLARGEFDAAEDLASRMLSSEHEDLAKMAAMITGQIPRRRDETEPPGTGEAMSMLRTIAELPTWYETRDFIRRTPEVFGDGSRSVLPLIRAVLAESDSAAYRTLLELLERCRGDGIDAAFAQLAPGDAQTPAGLRLLALQLHESVGRNDGGRYTRDAIAAALRAAVHPAWAAAPLAFRTDVAIEAGQALGWAGATAPAQLGDLAALDAAAAALLAALDQETDPVRRAIGPMLAIGVAAAHGDHDQVAVLAADFAASAGGLGAGERAAAPILTVAAMLSACADASSQPGLAEDARISLLRILAGQEAAAETRVRSQLLLARTLGARSTQSGSASERAEAVALLESVLANPQLGESARIDPAIVLAALLADGGGPAARIDQLASEVAAIAGRLPPGDSQATRALTGLSRVYLMPWHSDRAAAVAQAVALAERALAAAGSDPAAQAAIGVALLASYREGGDLAVLRRADKMLDLAWRAMPDDTEVAMRRTDSAVLIAYRDGDYGLLQDVADRLRAAVARSGAQFELLRSLGTALQNLGNHLQDQALLREAASVLTSVLDVVPAGVRHAASHDLAGCLLSLMNLTGDDSGIDRVVELASASVTARPAGTSQYSSYLDMCAVARYRRYQARGDVADLSAAVSYGTQAVTVPGDGSPVQAVYLGHLAAYLRERSQLPGHDDDAAAATAAYRQAAAARHTSSVLLSQHESWLVWAGRRQAWPEAAEAADVVLATWDELRRAQALESHQQARLRADQTLAGSAAYAYAMAGRPADAALALERGRARQIAEAMEEVRHDLTGLAAQGHADAVQRYRQAARTLRHVTTAGQAAADPAAPGQVSAADIADLRAQLDAAIAVIRSLPGRERFMAEPQLADLHEAAGPSPLVYLALTTFGGLALIVTAQSVRAVPLPELNTDDLLPGAGAFFAASMFGQAEPSEVFLAGSVIWLGRHVMRPVLDALPPGTGQAVLIPTGALAMLPLHAALLDPRSGRYACDEIGLTYAPSARVLLAARQRAGRAGPPPAGGGSVLIAAEPAPSAAAPLRHVPAEVDAVTAGFAGVTLLRGEAATRTAILAGLGSADVAHFACHGRADTLNPLAGHLLTAADERLTVADFMAADLAAVSLVVLSACQSARADLVVAEEALALPGAILQAGAQAAIGTLWEVNDLAGMLVISKFYRLWRAGGLAPDEALRQAQIWLRDSSLAAKQAEFPDVAELAPPDSEFAAIWDQINPYADPRYWAPYVYVGAGQDAAPLEAAGE